MGSSESKPTGPQVWKSSGPASVSQDLVDSLQSSHETDASRAKQIEIQVQARVAEELRKIQKKERDALDRAHEKLAADDKGKPAGEDQGPSRHTVGKEVEELRRKLEARKAVRALPDGVEGARADVVRCLREHDRRPLDCWQEVENFKAEVKKLEKNWVDKVSS